MSFICQEKSDPFDKPDIKELTLDALAEWLSQRGIERYRAQQIFKWIYIRQAEGFEAMSDLGKNLRKTLSSFFSIRRLFLQEVQIAEDGTRKFLFRLADGHHVESVLIPERDHQTLCISSQVGCAMGCTFCATARGGFIRNLTTGEILSQVRDLQKETSQSPITNIVFMGMGEPLANYDALIEALGILTDSDCGLKFSNRKITVSTSGLVPKMADLGRDTRVNLAVSLNATQNATRNDLMPVNRRFPLEALLDACRRYPLPPTRRITFEYVLLEGVNDTPEDARRLCSLLGPIRAKVNLIAFNEFEECTFKRPEEGRVLRFQKFLVDRNLTAVIRSSKGTEISAACGQLNANRRPPS